MTKALLNKENILILQQHKLELGLLTHKGERTEEQKRQERLENMRSLLGVKSTETTKPEIEIYNEIDIDNRQSIFVPLSKALESERTTIL